MTLTHESERFGFGGLREAGRKAATDRSDPRLPRNVGSPARAGAGRKAAAGRGARDAAWRCMPTQHYYERRQDATLVPPNYLPWDPTGLTYYTTRITIQHGHYTCYTCMALTQHNPLLTTNVGI